MLIGSDVILDNHRYNTNRYVQVWSHESGPVRGTEAQEDTWFNAARHITSDSNIFTKVS